MMPQNSPLEIIELVKQAQIGDKAAFSKLYELYFNKISQFLYFKTKDQDLALDLTQQTFLNAWRSMSQYKDMGLSFSSWLYKIAHNILVDYLRSKEKAIRIYDLLETLVHEPTFVTQTLDQDQLEKAIARLNDLEQQVILLRFVEGLTIEEIATILEKKKGLISTTKHRALQKLKKIVEQD